MLGKRIGWCCMPLIGGVALLALLSSGHSGGKGKAKTDDSRDKDRAAIRKATDSFLDAFEKGDAKAVAAHWTPDGEYITDDGVHHRGRTALEEVYKEAFAKTKGAKVSVDVETLRFPSRDTAVEEGYFKVRRGKTDWTTSRYSVLHVREDGKWLMAVVREWPAAGASLRDLEWLIGAWEAKRDDTEVRTVYEWWGAKNFIKVQLTIKSKAGVSTGFQMIGKDASTGHLRSWTFDADGDFAEATWAMDGKKWMLDSAAVQTDGDIVASVNIITPIDADSFTFQSVERSINGESLPDIAPIRVTRVKK